jgi:hypothetical protein
LPLPCPSIAPAEKATGRLKKSKRPVIEMLALEQSKPEI